MVGAFVYVGALWLYAYYTSTEVTYGVCKSN